MNKQLDSISQFIKKIRLSLGLTQEELAKRLGVSFTSVNRWENGQTQPSKLARKQIESLYQEMEHQGTYGKK